MRGLLPTGGLLKALPYGAMPDAPVPDLGRAAPPILRPEGRPIWQLLAAGFGNPWLKIPQQQNLRLYEQLVETVPLLDAALARTVELVGCPYVEAEPDVQADIEAWMTGLSVNRVQTGFPNWFATWLYDALLYGRAHAEIILPANRKDIYALQELHTRTIDLRPLPDLYSVAIMQNQVYSGVPVTLNPRVILTGVHDVRGDSPQGTSFLFGLPFVAEIVSSMLKDLKQTWERFGTPTYHVRYQPPPNLPDPTGARSQSFLSAIMGQFATAMKNRAEGNIQDFGTAGDIEVRVIGAAGEELKFVEPFRAVVEQVVAKTGLPPMMLGLQWATTERMSQVQASLLTQRVTKIRESVEGEIHYLIQLRQQLAGQPDQFTLCWQAPTLVDAFESARARLLDAQAESIELKNTEEKWRLGVVGPLDVARQFRPDLASRTDEEITTALPELAQEPPPLPAPAPFGAPPAGEPVPRSLSYGRRLPAPNGRH